MMRRNNYSQELLVAAHRNVKERDYWLNKLSGPLAKSFFPYDSQETRTQERTLDSLNFRFHGEIFSKLMALSRGVDHALHLIMVSAVAALLYRYTGNLDILVGSPIYRQESKGGFINTVLVLRNRLENNMKFIELLYQVKQTVLDASENQNYPLEILMENLDISLSDQGFPLFDTVILMENIQAKEDIQYINSNTTFSFRRTNEAVEGKLEYNSYLYEPHTVERIISHFERLLKNVLFDFNQKLSELDILSDEEKTRLIFELNDTRTPFPGDKTIHRLFGDQVEKTPDRIALVYENMQFTYRKLNEEANRLTGILAAKGVTGDLLVGIVGHRSEKIAVGMLAALKAGGAYLPINSEAPLNRIVSLLDDSNTSILLTDRSSMASHPLTLLQHRKTHKGLIRQTATRPQILDLDSIQILDRSLVDYEKYNQYIGEAAAKDSITLQATRGCPYHCAYCHKIWPKKHVYRSAENIFQEVNALYKLGIRRFSFIDDIFNLDKKNSLKFFEMIIKNKLDVQIFFPNGIRGDILTKEYIDTMIEAGTVNIGFALETGSPRLQKLIGKNLDVDKLRENMQYTCKTYPQVMTELFTMHGFPSETEKEALMTLDFVKSVKWIGIPYLLILKIYPDTDMEKLALEHGVSPEAIRESDRFTYHELPETLPFSKAFSRRYKTEFFNYIMSKERLLHVLPNQLKAFTRRELLMKYNGFFLQEMKNFDELLCFFGVTEEELGIKHYLREDFMYVPDLNKKLKDHFPGNIPGKDALRLLLLDLSQVFKEDDPFRHTSEAPLGLMYLLTNLNRRLGSKVNGKIYKSGLDFKNHAQLKEILDRFNPELIGIRTLTNTKNFFHRSVSFIKSWRSDIPIIAGGPYATSGYENLLDDRNIDLVVIGEGENTFGELIEKFIDNGKSMPGDNLLQEIPGLAFMPSAEKQKGRTGRDIVVLDDLLLLPGDTPGENPKNTGHPNSLAYAMFTSGSTGKPKAVLVEHKNVVRLVKQTNYVKFGRDDRVLQTGALDFDASTFEIWGPLLNGLTLYLPGKNQILEPDELKQAIARYGIGTTWMTSPLFNQMLDLDIEIFAGLQNLLVGGDALSPTHINRIKRRFPGLTVINGYGPTENTTFSLTYKIEREYRENIPIGKPIANSTAHILDRDHRLLPGGIAGELSVGGDGVARGYMNNPELTNEKFIHSPFGQKGRLYMTGDLAKWLPDGNIQFLGRMDQQVKIRGFRIELAEIEHILESHKNINNAVVLADMDENGEKVLVAYIVSKFTPGTETTEVSRVREFLSGEVPDYMIPAYFKFIDKIPLTANGKVDRQALPAIKDEKDPNYAAPRDEAEEKLVEIWAEILNKEKEIIGIDDNFFELGGHSLRAAQLVAKIHKTLDKKIPLEETFTSPTIRELAQHIKNDAAGDKFVSIKPVPKQEYYALSSSQKRLYFLHQMYPGFTHYNIPMAVELEGDINKSRIEDTVKKIIKRHESLRTSFELIDGNSVQEIHQEIDFQIEYWEGYLPGQVETISRDFIRPFELSQPPLLRVGLIKIEKERHVLVIDIHHIITDGTSMQIFIKDFMALYSGKNLPELRIQYKDFSQWQNQRMQSGELQAQEEYWLKEFADEIPVLNLPYDFPRPPLQDFAGRTLTWELSPGQTGALKYMTEETGATLFMIIAAVYTILLSRLSVQEDIVIGTPTAGRRHADLERNIGIFVNTLPLRNFPQGNKTVKNFLKEVKKRAIEAFDNQEYQFEVLVEKVSVKRDASRNPLFDSMFVLQNTDIQTVEIPGLRMLHYEYENKTAKFDLTLSGIELEDKLLLSFEYSTKLFKEETIKRFITYFKNILAGVLEDNQRQLRELEIISKEEKKQILYEFNAAAVEFPANKNIPQLFQEQAERTPDSTAAVYMGQPSSPGPIFITYNELNKKSLQLAYLLIEKGVKPDTIAALAVERSPEMIIGMMAILKAGGAYLPIDPAYPEDRINYMLADSGAKILVTTPVLSGKFEKLLIVNCQLLIINEKALDHRRFNNPPQEANSINNYQLTIDNLQLKGVNLAYIIYTSGSTGKAKGVMVEHDPVINRLHWMQRAYPIGERDRILQKTPTIFDVSVWELFWWSFQGASLCLLGPGEEKDTGSITSAIEYQGVTTLHFVPSMLTAFLEHVENTGEMKSLRSIRQVFSSGEALGVQQVKRFNRLLYVTNNSRLINLYGPTEATVDVSYFDCDLADEAMPESIPIGKPIDNIQLIILDKYLKFQPVGIVGELHIAGKGLARGYLNHPELTAAKFRTNHQCLITNDRLYQTGDLARWLLDGNIEFLGRIDDQVKIRGFRIELGEIQCHLQKHEKVKESVVLAIGTSSADKHLAAYIVLADGKKDEWTDIGRRLKEYLLRHLPAYMIPLHFVPIEKVPLTPNGKIDHKLLLQNIPIDKQEIVPPGNQIETKLAEIWAQVLGINKKSIGIDSDFFGLGGHSLKASIMLSRVHKHLHVKLPLEAIFKTPTIRVLAQYARDMKKDRYAAIKPVEEKEYYSLSPAQKRIYILQQMNPDSVFYNLPAFTTLSVKSEVQEFEKIFTQLVNHHESLRTSFIIVDDEPVQRIHKRAAFTIPYFEAKTDNEIKKITEQFTKPFDLSRAPLLRVGLIKVDQEKSILMTETHHTISDGLSLSVLREDFSALLTDQALSPLAIRYKDFSEWQNSQSTKGILEQQEKYWLMQFAGDISLLALPLDFPRPAVKSTAGDRVDFIIEKDRANKLRTLAVEKGVTLYMLFLAIFNILLHKISGQEDIIVGSDTAGRGHADLQNVIGMFVNTLALRNYPTGTKTFVAFLEEVKKRTLEAFDNQDYQFERLVEKVAAARDPGRNPIFDVTFYFYGINDMGQDLSSKMKIPFLDREVLDSGLTSSKFDLTLHVIESENKLLFTFEYCTKLFKAQKIQAFAALFQEIAAAVSEHPRLRPRDIKLPMHLMTEEKEEVKLDDLDF